LPTKVSSPATEKIVAEAVAVQAARARNVIGIAFIFNIWVWGDLKLIRNFITVGGRKSKTSQFLVVSPIIIEHFNQSQANIVR
jgi:hypothetical protein